MADDHPQEPRWRQRSAWSPRILPWWGRWGCVVLLLASVATLVADIVNPKSGQYIIGPIASIGLWTSLLVGDARGRRQAKHRTEDSAR